MERGVSKTEVRHMATLSRLAISAREEELFCRQFNAILDHMAILNSVNTENTLPLYTPIRQDGSTRLDEARDIRTRDKILANAPETDGEYFIVPRIV